MKKGIIITGAILSLCTTVLLAQSNLTATQNAENSQDMGRLFHADEGSLDLFGSGSLGRDSFDHLSGARIHDNGHLGAGGGLNYFITRHIGIGGDAYSENTAHNFVDSASGSLILRLPLGDLGLAPYIFGGAGYVFDPRSSVSGHGGAGLEFRFSHHFGIFVDARYVVTERVGNYGLGRAGFRFVF